MLYEYTKQKVEELGKQIIVMKQELFLLEEDAKKIVSCDAQYEIIENTLGFFEKAFDIASIDEKRAFIKSIIQKITWDGAEVNIFLYGESNQQEQR